MAPRYYIFIFRGQSNMEGFDPDGGSQMLSSVPTGLPTGCRYFESGTNGTGGPSNTFASGSYTVRTGLPTTGGFLSGASPAGAHHGPELQFVKSAVAYGIPEDRITVLKATRNGTKIDRFLDPGTPITDTGSGTSASGDENWRLKLALRAGRPPSGYFKIIDWMYQGEADAKILSSNEAQANDYGNRLDSLYAQLEALYGLGANQLPRNMVQLHPSIEGATNWVGSSTATHANIVRQIQENKADELINPGSVPAIADVSWAGGALQQYNSDALHIVGGANGMIPLGARMFELSIPLL